MRSWPEVTFAVQPRGLEFGESKKLVPGLLQTKFILPKGFEETMKTVRHCAVLVFFVAVCAALTFADEPGRHPAYLHALTDLRHARAPRRNRLPPLTLTKKKSKAW